MTCLCESIVPEVVGVCGRSVAPVERRSSRSCTLKIESLQEVSSRSDLVPGVNRRLTPLCLGVNTLTMTLISLPGCYLASIGRV